MAQRFDGAVGGSRLRHSAGAARALLSWALLVAAGSKALERDQFVSALDASRLVPHGLAAPAAAIVIAAELCVGFGLLLPRLQRPAAWGALALLWLFLLYNVWRLVAGIAAPCSCFGPVFTLSPGVMAVIDVILAAAALLTLLPRAAISGPGRAGLRVDLQPDGALLADAQRRAVQGRGTSQT